MSCDSVKITTGDSYKLVTATVGTYAGDTAISNNEVISEALMTFTPSNGCIGQTGKIVKAICRQYAPSGQVPNSTKMVLYLFNKSWTPPAASATWAFAASGSDGAIEDCVGMVTFAAADWITTSRSGIAVNLVELPFVCDSSSTSLFGVLVNESGGSITVKAATVFDVELTEKLN